MAKGPKGKGKLAQGAPEPLAAFRRSFSLTFLRPRTALAKQQHAASQRQQEARAKQAEEDRAKAVKAKMAAGGRGANGTKKRRVSEEGAGIRVGGADSVGLNDDKDIVQEKRRRVGIQPFRRGERILLVGEGALRRLSHELCTDVRLFSRSRHPDSILRSE